MASRYYDENSATVLQALEKCAIAYFYGRMLTIFYKKSFKLSEHFRPIIWDLVSAIGITVVCYFGVPNVYRFILISIIGVASFFRNKHFIDEKAKLIVLTLFIYLAIFTNFQIEVYTSAAIFFALTQFLRKPESLKLWLREIRVICGPVYVLLAAVARSRFLDFKGFHKDGFYNQMSLLASILATLVSAIFLRPDNNETIKCCFPNGNYPTFKTRKVLHGVLMSFGLGLLLIDVWFSSLSLLMMFMVMGIGSTNIVMYILVKTNITFDG